MARTLPPIFIGTNRYVAALHPRTGAEIWRTRLPHAMSAIVAVIVDSAYLYVGHSGYVYCLDKRLGSILWENGLTGLGYGPVMLTTEPDASSQTKQLYVGTSRHVAALSAASGQELWRTKLPYSGGTIISLLVGPDRIYAGCSGRAYALDKRHGAIQWENGLPRMGYHTVIVAREGMLDSNYAVAGAALAAQQAAAAAAGGGAAAAGS